MTLVIVTVKSSGCLQIGFGPLKVLKVLNRSSVHVLLKSVSISLTSVSIPLQGVQMNNNTLKFAKNSARI